MIQVLVLALGVGLGFAGSRALRRPQNAAAAASVARNVSGSLGRRRGLTAPELQRACFSEMVRHVQVDRGGRTHAPSRYVLHLHPDDVALVDESRRWFTDGLVAALTDAAREHGWSIDGKVSIEYQADPSRRPGVPTAVAAAPGASGASGEPDAVAVERSDTGERIELVAAIVTLGRSPDRDITVDDNRVSRAHLRFEHRTQGWVVVDEGSANGTLVRNSRVEAGQATPIRPGDVVSVGPVDLRIVVGSAGDARTARAGDPGTRALDDSDRNRISREFLPPHGTAR